MSETLAEAWARYQKEVHPSPSHFAREHVAFKSGWIMRDSWPTSRKVEVTDEMVERALEGFVGGPFNYPGSRKYWVPQMRAALTAALTPPVTESEES